MSDDLVNLPTDPQLITVHMCPIYTHKWFVAFKFKQNINLGTN